MSFAYQIYVYNDIEVVKSLRSHKTLFFFASFTIVLFFFFFWGGGGRPWDL